MQALGQVVFNIANIYECSDPQEIYAQNADSWEGTKKVLVRILGGVNPVITAQRWIAMTRDWDRAVSDHVAAWKCINMQYVLQNGYMIPTNAQAKLKLGAKWAIAAFELIKDKNPPGKPLISGNVRLGRHLWKLLLVSKHQHCMLYIYI
jgi:hypothetical protein